MKKSLSLILCICILASVFSFASSAEGIKGYSFRQADSNASNTYLFYNQLDARQKVVYNAVVGQKGGLNNNGQVSITDLSTFTASSESALSKLCQNAVIGALSAAIDDYPEYFWIGGYSTSFSFSISSGTYSLTNFDITFDEGNSDTSNYASFSAVKTAYTKMNSIIDSNSISGSTRYDKVKAIHDKIAELNTYDYTFSAKMNHHPTGVFLNGKSVCEGYAEAFKLLCDRESIPCILIIGTSETSSGSGEHEWNAVQMDDGKWYGVDVTWDDQDSVSKIYYDYFLTGTSSVDSNFTNKAWSVTHTADGIHYPASTFSLTYPTLSTATYSEWANKNKAPKLLSISNATKGIQLKWSALGGSAGYYVYRKTSTTDWKKIGDAGAALTYIDTKAVAGTTYTYTVRGYIGDGTVKSKYDTSGLSLIRLANPTIKVTNTTDGLKITWTKNTGDIKYIVYRKAAGESQYTKLGAGTNLYYTDKTAKAGTSYTYAVRSQNGSVTSWYTPVTSIRLANPAFTLANTADGVKVTITKVAGAKGYYVYRKTASGSYSKIGTTTSLTYLDKTAKAGTSYTYTVRAYNGNVMSAYAGKAIVRLTNPTITLTKTSAAVKVSWTKVAGAKGYYVYRKTGSGSYSKIGTTTSLTYVDKTAKTGTKYTYAVRAYNGSTLSAYNQKTITK